MLHVHACFCAVIECHVVSFALLGCFLVSVSMSFSRIGSFCCWFGSSCPIIRFARVFVCCFLTTFCSFFCGQTSPFSRFSGVFFRGSCFHCFVFFCVSAQLSLRFVAKTSRAHVASSANPSASLRTSNVSRRTSALSRLYAHTHTRTDTPELTHAHTRLHTHMHTRAHTHAHTRIHTQLGNFERCRTLYQKFLEFQPENCNAWVDFAKVCLFSLLFLPVFV